MRRVNRRAGVTIIEITMVLVLLAVLAGITHGSLKELLPRYRMVQTAKDLRNDIHALRYTAIEQSKEARVLLVTSDPDWSVPGPDSAGEWWLQVGNKGLRSNVWDTLPADMEFDGTDDSTDRGTVSIGRGGQDNALGVSLKPWDALSGPGTSNLDAIVFSPRGYVINPASDFDADGYITLTLVNKNAAGIDDSVALRIARSGMVRLESSLGIDEMGSGAGVAQTTERGS